MNYVVAAYIIIWVAFFAYIGWLGMKIGKLEREVASLKK